MKSFSLSFLLFLLFNGISSILTSEKCSRILEGTIYKPDTCAYQYLHSLGQKFRAQAQILFGPENQADAYVFSFEQEYGVYVAIGDAFGQVVKYNQNGTKHPTQSNKYTDTAQSYLNFAGFARTPSASMFYYTFSVFSPDAEYKAVTISMPLANDPLVC